MRDIDPIEGDALPALPKQTCSICGNQLSIYNKTGRCFHHSELGRLRRIREQRKQRERKQQKASALREKLGTLKSTLGATGEEIHGPSPEFIMTLVCQEFGISQDQLLVRLRKAPVVKARQVLMYLLYNDTSLSYPEIGQFLGGRDHTTVMYGVGKIDSIVETNQTVKLRIEKIRSYYRESSEGD